MPATTPPSAAELTYFVELCRTENLSRAAERLGVTQPTLSLALKRLEENVGHELVVRTRTGVRPTRAGNRLLARARDLIDGWGRLREEIGETEAHPRGIFSLGCHPAVASYALPAALPALLSRHPGLELRLVHDLSRRLVEGVISFRVDFGIVVNPVRHPDLVIRELGRDRVTYFAPAPARGAAAPRLDPRSGEAVLLADPDLLQTQTLGRGAERAGFRFARTVTSSDLDLLAALCAEGAGVAILPGRVASRFPGRKLAALPGAPEFQDRICLVYRRDAQHSAAARLLVADLAAAIRL